MKYQEVYFETSDDEEEKRGEDFDDSNLKNVQIYENEGMTFFYKYSTKTQKTAYYKCMWTKCGGRAAANYMISKDEDQNPVYVLEEELRITTTCTQKNEDHPWEINKEIIKDFEVNFKIN
jgi:hypothetical protein